MPQTLARREVGDRVSKRLPVSLITAPSNERAGRWRKRAWCEARGLRMPPKTPRSPWTSDLAAIEEGRPNLLTQQRGKEREEVRIKASRSTFDMRGPTRLAGAGPLDGRVGRLSQHASTYCRPHQ
jgi:hypothetical protein